MKKIIPFALVACLLISCSKKSSSGGGSTGGGGGGGGTLDCTTASKSFSANVLPIVQNKCALSGCHITGSTNGPGQLTNYSEIFNARVNIRSAVSSGIMPKTGSLTTAEKSSLLCWIDSGAPNN